MPEGHTIHRAARDHRKVLAGQMLAVSSPQGRFREGAKRLDGRRCVDVEAYGKHLIYRFDGALALHIHLGLFGRLRKHKLPLPEPPCAYPLTMSTAPLAPLPVVPLLNTMCPVVPPSTWLLLRRTREPPPSEAEPLPLITLAEPPSLSVELPDSR